MIIGQVKKWLFKFQSQVSEWMDLFARAFPKSEVLLMVLLLSFPSFPSLL